MFGTKAIGSIAFSRFTFINMVAEHCSPEQLVIDIARHDARLGERQGQRTKRHQLATTQLLSQPHREILLQVERHLRRVKRRDEAR